MAPEASSSLECRQYYTHNFLASQVYRNFPATGLGPDVSVLEVVVIAIRVVVEIIVCSHVEKCRKDAVISDVSKQAF